MKTYTTTEAAKQVGVSRQTLQAWMAADAIDAPELIKVGRISARLWARADIERAQKFKGTLKPGRVKKRN